MWDVINEHSHTNKEVHNCPSFVVVNEAPNQLAQIVEFLVMLLTKNELIGSLLCQMYKLLLSANLQ